MSVPRGDMGLQGVNAPSAAVSRWRFIGLDPTVVSSAAKSILSRFCADRRPDFLRKAPFVKSDDPHWAASCGFDRRNEARFNGRNVKSVATRCGVRHRNRALHGYSCQLAADDTTVGSRPIAHDVEHVAIGSRFFCFQPLGASVAGSIVRWLATTSSS